jgi:hypothetical protein
MASGIPAQQFLAIETIREDAIVLKSGGFRVVLMCSSFNFALKSADEQEAIIYQYQNFLNSLDFPIQFIIHSRRLNTAPYLEKLRERQKEEDNELLKIQIAEYVEFIKTFSEMTNIMSKTFYVAVPFTPPLIRQQGILAKIGATLKLTKKTANSESLFNEYKNQLWQRVDTVVLGLQHFGIRAAPLNTEELIELFYGLYNPTEFEQAAKPEKES